MAISINWSSKVITVPQADLTLVSGSLYELDVDAFRLTLKSLEDDEAGISFPVTHNHNAPVSVGGTSLARVIEIVNGYTCTFEDGQYAVRLVGANNNLPDVTNVNQVSVRSQNSAGLIVSGSGVTAQDKLDIAAKVLDEVMSGHMTAGTLGAYLDDIKNRVGRGIKRGVAVPCFQFLLVSPADHITPVEGIQVTALYKRDGETQWSVLDGAVVDIGDGVYHVPLSATELDAKSVTLKFEGVGADPRIVTIVTAE